MHKSRILKHYGIKEGVLCLDDVDRARSKPTKRIYKVQKLKDKLTGGFLDGQCIVFLFLVTPVASFPVGFESYPLIPQAISVRGKEDIEIFISSARLENKLPAWSGTIFGTLPEKSGLIPTKDCLAVKFKKLEHRVIDTEIHRLFSKENTGWNTINK